MSSYHHGDLRRALLREADVLVREGGPDAVRLRALARRIGVSHTACYRHFATRQDLLDGLAAEGFAALDSAYAEVLAVADVEPLARFASAGLAYVRFATENPQTFRLMFGSLTRREGPLADAAHTVFDGLVAMVAEGQATGDLRAGDPRVLALAAWALVHGLASLTVERALPERDLPTGDELAAQLSLILLQGLGAR